jgi:hypothetical protein
LNKVDKRFARNTYAAKMQSREKPVCQNCNSRQHYTRQCPDPVKRSPCIYCDGDDHQCNSLATCPNRICHRVS